MTITFFSNYMNIHQLPFCEELMKHIGTENFKFVSTRQMDSDRVQMGFEDMNVTKPFVVREYEDEVGRKEAHRLAIDSDVVIFGSAPTSYLNERMRLNKLAFKYNERILKRGDWMYFHPAIQRQIRKTFTDNNNKDLYVLCASAYTKRDLSLFGFPGEKCFKWGYFPEVKHYDSYEQVVASKKTALKRPGVSILWAGRLIGWKHPEVPVYVAKQLRKKGINFELNMIGEGPERERTAMLIAKNHLEDFVHLLGAKEHDFVLEMMEKSDIFLFTSDRNEGWGAVLNEAMNAGCAVVANKAIGSVPFLIEDGKSGLMYSSQKESVEKIMYLIGKEGEIQRLGKRAKEATSNVWSIENATANLMTLIEELSNGDKITNKKGPCSRA